MGKCCVYKNSLLLKKTRTLIHIYALHTFTMDKLNSAFVLLSGIAKVNKKTRKKTIFLYFNGSKESKTSSFMENMIKNVFYCLHFSFFVCLVRAHVRFMGLCIACVLY